VKKFCIVLNCFIWIIIKNYWCDIKSEKSENVLMLIGGRKYKKLKKKRKDVNSNSIIMFCSVSYQTRPQMLLWLSSSSSMGVIDDFHQVGFLMNQSIR
jgi:hypothetical protein